MATTKNVQIVIETITRGQQNVKAVQGSFDSLVKRVQSGSAQMAKAQESAASQVARQGSAFDALGKRIEAADAKVAALQKKLAKSTAADLPVKQFIQLDKSLESATKNAEKLRTQQENVSKRIAESKKLYDQLGTSIKSNEDKVKALARQSGSLATAFRNVGPALVRGVSSAVSQASTSISKLGSSIASAVQNGARNGVRSAGGAIDSLVSRLRGVGNVPIVPKVDINLSALTGSLTRAVALGSILASTLLGLGKAAINFGINQGKGAFEAVASYERLGLSYQQLAKREIERNATVTKNVVIGRKLITAAQQEAAANNVNAKALQVSQKAADKYTTAVNGQATSMARINKLQVQIAEFGKRKNESDAAATARLQGLQAALQSASTAYERYSRVVNSGSTGQSQALSFQDRWVTVTKKVTELTKTDAQIKAEAAVAAKELLNWTEKLAILSPFSTQDVAATVRQGLALGFTIKETKRLTEAVVDFTSASGQSGQAAEQVIRALGQIRGKGKLAGQEVLQLIDAGVPVYEILGKAFGKTTAELVKMQEKGLLPAEKVIAAITQAFEDDFGGSAKEASGTLGGLRASLFDLKEVADRDFFSPLFKRAQPVLQSFVDTLQDADFRAFVQRAGSAFASISAVILRPLSTALAFVLKFGKKFGQSISAGEAPIDALKRALTGIVSDETILKIQRVVLGFEMLAKNFKEAKTPAEAISKTLRFVGLGKAADLFDLLVRKFEILKARFKLGGIRDVITGLGIPQSVLDSFDRVVDGVGRVRKVFEETRDPVATIRAALDEIGGSKAVAAFDKITRKVGELRDAFATSGVKGVAEFFGIPPEVATNIQKVADAIGRIPSAIASLDAQQIVSALGGLGEAAYNTVKSTGIGGKILQALRETVGDIVGSVPGIVASIFDPTAVATPVEQEIAKILTDITAFLLETATRALSSLVAALTILAVGLGKQLLKEIEQIGANGAKAVIDMGVTVIGALEKFKKDVNTTAGFKVFDVLPFDVKDAGEVIKGNIQKAANARKEAIDKAADDEIAALQQRAKTRDKEIQAAFFGGEIAIDTSAIKFTTTGTPGEIPQIKEAGAAVGGQFQKAVSDKIGETVGTVTGTIDSTGAVLIEKTTGISTTLTTFEANTLTGWRTMFDDIKVATDNGFQAVRAVIEGRTGEILAKIRGWLDEITILFQTKDWNFVGRSMVDGIVTGLVQQEGKLYAKIKSLINTSVKVARETADIASPSKRTAKEIGQPLIQGITVGAEKESGRLQGSIQDIIDGALGTDIKAGELTLGIANGAAGGGNCCCDGHSGAGGTGTGSLNDAAGAAAQTVGAMTESATAAADAIYSYTSGLTKGADFLDAHDRALRNATDSVYKYTSELTKGTEYLDAHDRALRNATESVYNYTNGLTKGADFMDAHDRHSPAALVQSLADTVQQPNFLDAHDRATALATQNAAAAAAGANAARSGESGITVTVNATVANDVDQRKLAWAVADEIQFRRRTR
jgi:tape measure domain-containing protein